MTANNQEQRCLPYRRRKEGIHRLNWRKNNNRIWQVVYPIGIYYVVSSLMFFALSFLFEDSERTYMLRQLICAVFTIPFTMSFYKQDMRAEDIVFGKKERGIDGRRIGGILIAALSAGALGIAVNNTIAYTPLMKVSAGFQEANEAFFGGSFAIELLGSCLMIPIAEELLFRGVVYKRMSRLAGDKLAIVFSALLFGVLHANLGQFFYAAVVGALLAFLIRQTGSLLNAIVGHMAANTIAVIRAETGWLDFSYHPNAAGIGFTVFMFAVAAGFLWVLAVRFPREAA